MAAYRPFRMAVNIDLNKHESDNDTIGLVMGYNMGRVETPTFQWEYIHMEGISPNFQGLWFRWNNVLRHMI